MTDLHAKDFPSTFASSSHNLKKTFWHFFENFRFSKILYKTIIMFKGLEFLNILLFLE